MSGLYRLRRGSVQQRGEVLRLMPRLNELEDDLKQRAVTAWVTAWLSTARASPLDMPYSLQAPRYGLIDHTNEVADIGLLLNDYAERRWGVDVARDSLLATLLLHDIDKALLYRGDRNGVVEADTVRSRLPHGVLGALLLREAGLPDDVVVPVATHATTSPVKNSDAVSWILHYADLFACDHAFAESSGTVPFFQRI